MGKEKKQDSRESKKVYDSPSLAKGDKGGGLKTQNYNGVKFINSDSTHPLAPSAREGGQNATTSTREGEFDTRESPQIRNTKKGKRGFKRVYNAFFYSLDGLKAAFCEEEAFRQILIISAILIPLGAYLGDSFSEKVLLILPCILAIIAELTNSAIENAIDFAGLEIHPFAKKAKDMGSAIQLVACVFMAGVWVYFLLQRFVL